MVKGRGSRALVEVHLDELARIERLIGLGANPERLPRGLRPGHDAAEAASISASISIA